MLRPLPLIRHKVPGLTAALASYLRRLRALARRLPSRTRLAGPLRTQAGGRMLTLAGAAAFAVLGVIAVGGDTSPLSHAMAFPTRQIASPPGTTATAPATSATGSAHARRPLPGTSPRAALGRLVPATATAWPATRRARSSGPTTSRRCMPGAWTAGAARSSSWTRSAPPRSAMTCGSSTAPSGCPGRRRCGCCSPPGRCRATTRATRTWWMRPARPPPMWRPRTRSPREPASCWPRRRRPRP